MDYEALRQQIPYQWRVQSYSKYKAQAQCVAYIDARDVMTLLDQICGPDKWQSDYKDIGGQMFAGIGICCPAKDADTIGYEWVWKWDTGTETKVEAEKGQASDSFKRAAVKWGIGRFLYDLDIKYVTTDAALSDTHKYPAVIDDQGNKVWDLTKHINGSKAPTVPRQASKTASTATKAPTREEDMLIGQRERIAEFVAELRPLAKTKEARRKAIKELTGLDPVEDNYAAIMEALAGKVEAIENGAGSLEGLQISKRE